MIKKKKKKLCKINTIVYENLLILRIGLKTNKLNKSIFKSKKKIKF